MSTPHPPPGTRPEQYMGTQEITVLSSLVIALVAIVVV